MTSFYTAETNLYDTQPVHRDPNEEMRFYLDIANGEVEKIENNCREGHFANMEDGVGILSRNPVTNIKYHFVVTISMATRFCCEAGMEKEYAYQLSDFYIRQLDDLSTEQAVISLHDVAVMDFTRKMRMLKQNFSASKPVNEALEYIYTHIKNRLTIDEVADALCLSRNYLSRLFKSEVGISFSDYVREEKIKRAKNLLRHTDYSLIDIALYLGFSSQSHFTQVFKKTTGLTPKAFRNELYQTVWKTHSESGRFEAASAFA